MEIRWYAKSNKCLWAYMNMNFRYLLATLGRLPVPKLLSGLYFLLQKKNQPIWRRKLLYHNAFRISANAVSTQFPFKSNECYYRQVVNNMTKGSYILMPYIKSKLIHIFTQSKNHIWSKVYRKLKMSLLYTL